jgi:ankyrin repeat protein
MCYSFRLGRVSAAAVVASTEQLRLLYDQYYGHVDVVRVLLSDARIDPTVDENYAIRIAADRGHVDVVRVLLSDPRVDPAAEHNHAIGFAAFNGHCDVVRVLLSDSRIDPGADDNFAIRYAALSGHVDIVRILVSDSRADPTAGDNHAIRLAAQNGHADVVSVLLSDDPRVDPAAHDNDAIRLAAKNGHADVVRVLLSDARVDPADRDNYADVVRVLLSNACVDPTACQNEALRWAVANGHVVIVEELLLDVRCSAPVSVAFLHAAPSHGCLCGMTTSAQLTNPILLRMMSVKVGADWWIAEWRDRIDEYRKELHSLMDWLSFYADGVRVHRDVIDNVVGDYLGIGVRRNLLDRHR